MIYIKSWNKKLNGSNYGEWVDVSITREEEVACEVTAQMEHNKLMDICIDDARKILLDNGTRNAPRTAKSPEDYGKSFASNTPTIMNIAVTLFEKRASHTQFYKERKARDNFDNGNYGG